MTDLELNYKIIFFQKDLVLEAYLLLLALKVEFCLFGFVCVSGVGLEYVLSCTFRWVVSFGMCVWWMFHSKVGVVWGMGDRFIILMMMMMIIYSFFLDLA